ncbi:MAG: DUF1501 domain-containing protein [Planctomycetaceae bacterium]
MLTLQDGSPALLCQRREFLRFGSGLAASGLLLPELVAAAKTSGAPRGKAKSCILVYLLGGPPHQDMFDLKPDAPAEIRGPFRPIDTSVPGVQICEHLPRLAKRADRFALVRSVSRRNSNHTPMIYYTLTGHDTAIPNRDNDVRPPQRTDFPHMGSVISRFKPTDAALPGYVALPEVAIRSSIRGQYKRARSALRGGGPGFLGPRYAALNVNGPPGTREAIPTLALPKNVTVRRFEERAALLSLLDRGAPRVPTTEQLGTLRKRAVMLTGAANRGRLETFSLDGEPAKLRDRYGRHRFGQSLLLARRLSEAGVPMVAVHFNEMTVCDGWDTHSKNFEALKTELLPMVDQGLSALLDDLQRRGTLGETLVVCLGEFGRTPKINKNAGRDHWGECSTTLLLGGGIRSGQVYGSSDNHAAYPKTNPVDPADIQATIYHCLGLDPRQPMYDLSDRAWPISNGTVIRGLV